MIKRKELYYIPLIFLFLLPDFFQRFSVLYYSVLVFLSIVSLFTIYQYIKRPRYLFAFELVSSIYILIILSTIINNGVLPKFLLQSLVSIGFFCFIILRMKDEESKKVLLNDLIFVFETYVTINLIIMVIMPNGLYRITSYTGLGSNPAYLLGHRNNAVEYLIPLCGLVTIKNKCEGRIWSLNMLFVLVISSLSAIYTWSANEILCMTFIVLSLIVYGRKGLKLYSIRRFLILSAILSSVLILIGVLPFMQYFIVSVLKKSATLTGRTRIWTKALLSISEKIILGHGVQSSLYNYLHLSMISSCHNYFLDFLYLGGVLTLVVIVVYVLYIDNNMRKTDLSISSLMSIFVGSYFILWIATPMHKENLFIMLSFFIILLIMGNSIDKQYSEVKK